MQLKLPFVLCVLVAAIQVMAWQTIIQERAPWCAANYEYRSPIFRTAGTADQPLEMVLSDRFFLQINSVAVLEVDEHGRIIGKAAATITNTALTYPEENIFPVVKWQSGPPAANHYFQLYFGRRHNLPDCAVPTTANLLRNASFEEHKNGVPSHWWSDNPGTISSSSDRARSGGRALMITTTADWNGKAIIGGQGAPIGDGKADLLSLKSMTPALLRVYSQLGRGEAGGITIRIRQFEQKKFIGDLAVSTLFSTRKDQWQESLFKIAKPAAPSATIIDLFLVAITPPPNTTFYLDDFELLPLRQLTPACRITPLKKTYTPDEPAVLDIVVASQGVAATLLEVPLVNRERKAASTEVVMLGLSSVAAAEQPEIQLKFTVLAAGDLAVLSKTFSARGVSLKKEVFLKDLPEGDYRYKLEVSGRNPELQTIVTGAFSLCPGVF